MPKFEANIPRKGISGPQSQFSDSCVCERIIIPRWSCRFCWRKYVDRSWEYVNRSQTHECRNWGWGRAIPRKGTYDYKILRTFVQIRHFWILSFWWNVIASWPCAGSGNDQQLPARGGGGRRSRLWIAHRSLTSCSGRSGGKSPYFRSTTTFESVVTFLSNLNCNFLRSGSSGEGMVTLSSTAIPTNWYLLQVSTNNSQPFTF